MLSPRTLATWSTAAAIVLATTLLLALRGIPACADLFDAFDYRILNPEERKLLEFLLLLPVATTIVCIVRVVIGLSTFGTFAPALLGLAFREVESPVGVFVLLIVLSAGWFLRHAVQRLHLLQVPRTSFMLSLVVVMLIAFVFFFRHVNLSPGRVIPLFPLVILTGMIERFWTVDEERGTRATFQTLLVTLGVCGLIGITLRSEELTGLLLARPETLGFVMAGQLLLGRFTGYRLTELYRFRMLLRDDACTGSSAENDSGNLASWG